MNRTLSQLLVDRAAAPRGTTPGEVNRFRMEQTALRQVQKWILPGESEDCGAVANRLPELVARAAAKGDSVTTLRAYASRATRVFRNELQIPMTSKRQKPRRAAAPKVEPAPSVVGLTFEAQIQEALTALARWPLLRAGLLPALLDIDKKRREDVSNGLT